VRELVVGFDLDMTLIDSRPGIAATWAELARRTGVPIDVEATVSRLGPPLEVELATWFPADEVAARAREFRALYPDFAILGTSLLPGARAAVDAVHRHGGRAVVVTAKYEPNARLHLDHLGLQVDDLVGWRWGPAKGAALTERGATIYVGDHESDMVGAKAAGAVGVGVATGPVSAADLTAAGADVVLASLDDFACWLDGFVLDQKVADLGAHLQRLGSVLVAFSGGADSALVLAAAVRALGTGNVVAATAVSASLPESELDQATVFARDLGVRHLMPRTEELDDPRYRANAGNRCYFCKAELLDVLVPLAAEHGLAHVLTGTNHDDAVADFRPGIRAAAERGAVAPLRDAGFTKPEVRAASRAWGLRTWDKPAAACLSSRIAYGITITSGGLARVERAEQALRATLTTAGIDVSDLRVRDRGEDRASIEVDAELVYRVADSRECLAAVRAAGFSDVEVDPRGYRSGSMNDALRARRQT
jgi:pyridinium-3,5-biscarboxylic acid mononucleotide sulfurtransferase